MECVGQTGIDKFRWTFHVKLQSINSKYEQQYDVEMLLIDIRVTYVFRLKYRDAYSLLV